MIDLTPGSEDWRKLVTASKVSAILGVSPWESPRSVWHLMHGDLPASEQSRVQARGTHLEAGILNWYFADNPELSRVGSEVTLTRPDLPWAAATPDDIATTADGIRFPVDAKTDGRGDGWGEPGTDQVPLHYLCQAMWVMHLGGFDTFVFTRLGPYLERDEFPVAYDAELARDIEQRCHAFYLSLAADEPPELDGTTATYDAVRASVPIGEGDWEAPLVLARELVESRTAVSVAEQAHNLARSRILDSMGDAKRAMYAGVCVGQKQRTKAGAALYPPRKPVDLSIFTPEAPEATNE